jgi:hypothetical protein
MISLWFLIIGIVFGTISSIYAKSKNRHAENWFTLGLFFWFFALIALYFLSDTSNIQLEGSNEGEEFSFPY